MARALVGIGTNFNLSGPVSDVYFFMPVVAGTGAPPYNFAIKYGSENLYTSTYAPVGSWVRITPPTGGWTSSKVRELTVYGEQYGTYLTNWSDTFIKVIGGPFTGGDTGAFFAFFYS